MKWLRITALFIILINLLSYVSSRLDWLLIQIQCVNVTVRFRFRSVLSGSVWCRDVVSIYWFRVVSASLFWSVSLSYISVVSFVHVPFEIRVVVLCRIILLKTHHHTIHQSMFPNWTQHNQNPMKFRLVPLYVFF